MFSYAFHCIHAENPWFLMFFYMHAEDPMFLIVFSEVFSALLLRNIEESMFSLCFQCVHAENTLTL